MTDICYPNAEQPQTRRGQERRLALLLCATDLILEKGYDAVSLDDIVNHGGGSKASIYKYFGNKEGLFTAICDYRRELFFKDICVPYISGVTDLRNYLIQNSVSLALEQANHASEIFCSNPHYSATMYFGILRDVEWRMLMGLDAPENDQEIFDYINFSVDLFLKAHQKN